MPYRVRTKTEPHFYLVDLEHSEMWEREDVAAQQSFSDTTFYDLDILKARVKNICMPCKNDMVWPSPEDVEVIEVNG